MIRILLISDPESRGQKDTGCRIRIRNSDIFFFFAGEFWLSLIRIHGTGPTQSGPATLLQTYTQRY